MISLIQKDLLVKGLILKRAIYISVRFVAESNIIFTITRLFMFCAFVALLGILICVEIMGFPE